MANEPDNPPKTRDNWYSGSSWKKFSFLSGESVERRLPSYLYWYFERLREDYKVLPVERHSDPIYKDAERILLKKSDLLWEDLFAIERILLDLQSDGAIKKRVLFLREQCKTIFGADFFEKYTTVNNSIWDIEKADVKSLREELHLLVGEVHGYYLEVEAREKALSKVKGDIVRSAIYVIAVIVFSLWVYSSNVAEDFDKQVDPYKILFIVVFFGVVGAFTSIIRRAAALPSTNTYAINTVTVLLNLNYSFGTIISALFFGAIFSVILTFLFLGNFIEGALFPKFMVIPLKDGAICKALMGCVSPETQSDFFKLLVWSFLAGYAENLVPDALDRVRGKLLGK